MITMMNLINMIPDHIGWTLVGALGMACVFMLFLLGKTFVEMYKDWHEDLEQESED